MGDGNVLIVEDELIIAREMEFRLRELGCAVIAIAETGHQALQVLEVASPDLVLMDIGLKGPIDGVETAEEIARRWSVPVIYVTAFGEDAVEERARATNPNAYLVKPFSADAFRESVETVLHRERG